MITNRILKIIELYGENKNQFYKKTGLSNGFLDKVKDIGVSKLEYILNSYPSINPEWLLTGKGSMLREEVKPTGAVSVPDQKANNNTNANYKELAEARLEVIDGLKYRITALENELKQLKTSNSNPETAPNPTRSVLTEHEELKQNI
ncbi:MAG: peptidase S24 [Flavobacterium sp.]